MHEPDDTRDVDDGLDIISFALGASLVYYIVQGAPGDAGTVTGALRSVNFDGTGDALVAGNLANPYWVAVSGSRIFWVDDPITTTMAGTATVNCIGCNGMTSTPWITGLTQQTYGIIADQNDIYVVIDDGMTGLPNFIGEVYACSTQTACGGSPRKVIDQAYVLTSGGTTALSFANPSLTSDGTYVYVSRQSDIVRVDGTGQMVTIVNALSPGPGGVAFDGMASNLYYATDSAIFRSKIDGTSPKPVVCGQSGLGAVAVDMQNVYFVNSLSGTNNAPLWAPK